MDRNLSVTESGEVGQFNRLPLIWGKVGHSLLDDTRPPSFYARQFRTGLRIAKVRQYVDIFFVLGSTGLPSAQAVDPAAANQSDQP